MSNIKKFFLKIKQITITELVKYCCYFFGSLAFLSIPLFTIKIPLLTWIFFAIFMISMLAFIAIRKRLSFCFISLATILFFVTALISTLVSKNKVTFTLFLLGLTFIFLMAFLFDKTVSVRFFGICLFISVALFTIVFLIVYRNEIGKAIFFQESIPRLGALFGDENEIAMYFAFGATISFYFLMFSKRKIKLIIVSSLLFILFSFLGFLSGTKAFIISVVISVFVLIVLFFGKKKWFLSLTIIIGIVVFLLLILQIPIFNTIKERLEQFILSIFYNSSTDASTSDRLTMIEDAFILFFRRPLFGYGINAYYYYSAFGGGGWTHNELSEISSSYGIIGLITYFFPHVFCFLSYYKSNVKQNLPLYLCLLIFVFSWMFSMPLETIKFYPFCLALICAGMCKSSVTTYHLFYENKKFHFLTEKPIQIIDNQKSNKPQSDFDIIVI